MYIQIAGLEKVIRKYLKRNLSLTKRNHTDELIELLKKETLTDVTLHTQDAKAIRAHKIILAARSRCVGDSPVILTNLNFID